VGHQLVSKAQRELLPTRKVYRPIHDRFGEGLIGHFALPITFSAGRPIVCRRFQQLGITSMHHRGCRNAKRQGCAAFVPEPLLCSPVSKLLIFEAIEGFEA
jgi:hypothetical protein